MLLGVVGILAVMLGAGLVLLGVCAPLLTMSNDAKLTSVDFEIFGNVQGVCFRMYTEDKGRSLGLSGWVKNTRQGTVIGQIQGPPIEVKEMMEWLRSVGSPSSRIDRAVFSNERNINKMELRGFSTRH